MEYDIFKMDILNPPSTSHFHFLEKHPQIIYTILERIEEQGSSNMVKEDDNLESFFNFSDTPEGVRFWESIFSGFSRFYEKYPQNLDFLPLDMGEIEFLRKHPRILEKLVDKNSGNLYDYYKDAFSSFNWTESEEGYSFWRELLIYQNTSEFYTRFYPNLSLKEIKDEGEKFAEKSKKSYSFLDLKTEINTYKVITSVNNLSVEPASTDFLFML